METGYINGLRAFAAMSVLVAHCMIWSGWPGLGLPDYIPNPGEFAKMAVDLFMILSGFLMMLNAHQRSTTEPMSEAKSWSLFYLRRLFRIVPTYYLAVFFAVVLGSQVADGMHILAGRVPWLDRLLEMRDADLEAARLIVSSWSQYFSYDFVNIFMHITFLFGLFPLWVSALPLPDWSLSSEIQFYLVFPALLILSQRFGVIKFCTVLALICVLVTVKWRTSFPEPSLLPFKLPVFFAGMTICQAMLVRPGAYRIALNVFSVALMATQYEFYGGRVAIVMAMSAFIVFLASDAKNSSFASVRDNARRPFQNSLANFLSDLAYPIYLFHSFWIMLLGGALFRVPIFAELNPHVRTVLFIVAIVLGTIVVSKLIHRFIEVPGINAGRWVLSRLSARKSQFAESKM
ncbi:UNVERIFIED_ORG: peptidoglycan/LPS O-acetylase OafA/YrhL [Rhizobium sp. SORGH_AS260]|uniref:acyltransferase family protein n=1 Tax=Agrobacterium TaxID=357 RepID=UPI001FCDC866|nr:acyltransferase [Agrobacterium sp. SORGH_AS_0440]MCJ2876695.1 acyltransferase [Agrobacterium pusense]MDP9730827.1 peptidoglycan/LPS O-acetylase OafA/YrhL [Rhizobium sp. SORGH_AS_0285]MDP9753116.1 peptidoglycan/LPS O-acetylase OafA/YrhL [Rhizobium sp. SORGH_AS_0260]MDR6080084.1 peptidoglycan/LPS O-acetylase OafA/YrhL [Agrobacterium sp. SORGH_AS_0440]